MDNDLVIVLAVIGAFAYMQKANAADPYGSIHAPSVAGYGNYLSPSRSGNPAMSYFVGTPLTQSDGVAAMAANALKSSAVSKGASSVGSALSSAGSSMLGWVTGSAADAAVANQYEGVLAASAGSTAGADVAGLAALDSAAAAADIGSAAVADATASAVADAATAAAVDAGTAAEGASIWETIASIFAF